MMNADMLKPVMELYRFDDWASPETEAPTALRSLDDLDAPRGLFADSESLRIRNIDTDDETRLLRMSWSPSREKGGLILIDARICGTVADARRALLEILANLQAPDIVRLETGAPGDVAFSRDPSSAIYFVRGNVAVSIANGGETVLPIGDVASALDSWAMGGEQ